MYEYANKPQNAEKSLDISAECRIPHHAAPFHTTPRDAALVPQLLWQILH
jgi:hypothetical protein